MTVPIVDGMCPVHGRIPPDAHGPAWIRAHARCGEYLDRFGIDPARLARLRDVLTDDVVDALVEKEYPWGGQW